MTRPFNMNKMNICKRLRLRFLFGSGILDKESFGKGEMQWN